VENKIAHLGFIQGAINRMAGNSFLIKGWIVTLVAAIFALSTKSPDAKLTWLAIAAILIFWSLDTYYLRQEKLFRRLYEKVADGSVDSNKFTMNTSILQKEVQSFFSLAFSISELPFYFLLILLMFALAGDLTPVIATLRSWQSIDCAP
jgi:hypothetical protein